MVIYHMTLSPRLTHSQNDYKTRCLGLRLSILIVYGIWNMERPASDEAIAEYNRECRERYGMEIVQASNDLYHNPNDPLAHKRYVEAIGRMLNNQRGEQ